MKTNASFRSVRAYRLSGLFATSLLVLSCSHDQAAEVAPRTSATADAVAGCPASAQIPQIVGHPELACGCYTVNSIAANKQAYLNAGADAAFLASTMMETENMDAKSYPNGDNKTYDAYNAGAAKQNWGMIRRAWPAYRTYKDSDYLSAGNLNVNRKLDVDVYKASRSYFGFYNFFAGHRWGQRGWSGQMSDSDKADVAQFIAAYNWTLARLNSDGGIHKTDNTRFYVSLRAVRPVNSNTAPTGILAGSGGGEQQP